MVWVFIILGIICFIGFCSLVEITNGIAVLTVFLIFGIGFSIMGIRQEFCPEPITYEYPNSEYVLEYKVTTIGEKCDTTYVLTKIKTD